MKPLRKKVYMTAGYNTVSLGTGRPEFTPQNPRPGIEHYLNEAGRAVIALIGGADHIDECVVGNFMASRFNKQAHLGAFFPMIDEKLRYKPCMRVEGACASGGLALTTGIRSILAETADVVLVIGVEVQNSVKAVYGADILAGAGWYKNRKKGHAYFFPGEFSDRAGAYFEKFGRERTRKAFAKWYANCIENARLCPTAQEYGNKTENLEQLAMKEPDPNYFVDHLNYFDCSKVSDGASAIIIASEQGLVNIGVKKKDAVEIKGWAQVQESITYAPQDATSLSTMHKAVHQALEMAGITKEGLATVETHDCFTIAGVLAVEAIGFAPHGEGVDFVLEGHTSRGGRIPFNTTGGLIGWGHPTGATGVHQAVTSWEQLTKRAGKAEIHIPAERPYALSVNMGGNDKTVVALVYKNAEK